MKVDANSSVSIRNISTSNMTVQYRTGDVVVVQALKVQNSFDTTDEVLLKFPNGDLLTAILNNGLLGKEGDHFYIQIQSISDNRIYARIVSNAEQLKTLKNEVVSLLTSLKVSNTEDNYQIAMQMLRSGIAQTSENFELFVRYKKKYQESSLEQIAFLLKNKIQINDGTVKTIELLISHYGLIGDEMIRLLSKMDDEERNDEIKYSLKNFYKNPLNNEFDAGEIKGGKTIKELIDLLQSLKVHMSFGEDTNKVVKSFISNVETIFEMVSHLQNPLYLQIPIQINGNYGTAELYVLKQKSAEKQKNKQSTLFLRVPTMHLGIVELFLHIDSNKNMQCHFLSPKHSREIQNDIVELSEMIEKSGFRLTKVTYNHLPSDISIQNFEKYVELILDKKKFDERV